MTFSLLSYEFFISFITQQHEYHSFGVFLPCNLLICSLILAAVQTICQLFLEVFSGPAPPTSSLLLLSDKNSWIALSGLLYYFFPFLLTASLIDSFLTPPVQRPFTTMNLFLSSYLSPSSSSSFSVMHLCRLNFSLSS